MELIRSNRTEALADALADKARNEPLSPLLPDVIVVQSRGMERWLTLELTRRLGIWANPWFPFPRAFIEWVLCTLDVADTAESSGYEPSRLTWTIAELLRTAPPEGLAGYLGQPSSSLGGDRLLRLASRIAVTFDSYAMLRPDRLAAWTAGDESHWQAELWRRACHSLGDDRSADLGSRIEQGIAALKTGDIELPLSRVQLFAVETLPPSFLRFFGELSRAVPTTLYLLEPSRQYWGDAPSRTERASMPLASQEGHPLLSDAGKISRDFHEMVVELGEAAVESDASDRFVEPGRDTLLHRLQSDVLDFAKAPAREHRSVIDGDDGSISIHACDGPMREAEVLHDLLLGALEDDPNLRPEDIVVMTPDLDRYAPVFRAVFREDGAIPYEVHDRRTRNDAVFYEDLLRALEIVDSRFSVLDLVGLTEADSLRDELRFTQDERVRIADLVSSAGVRWGIDADHRRHLGFPDEDLHTWRAGLRRLFLGFASVPDSTEVFEGVLPRGAASLGDAALVARLSRLVEALFAFERDARTPRSPEAWASRIGELCIQLFGDDASTEAVLRVLSALDTLASEASDARYQGDLSLRAVRRELQTRLVESTPAVGFLDRGVTLTQLVPLRSIPFKLVCLIGMSEESFPRNDDRPSFDLTRHSHRRGDRNKRDDDRHSFLQAVLCARDRLIITYSAPTTSARSEAHPSPVVWELIEALDSYYVCGDGDLVPTVDHPLHAYDSRYFDGTSLPQSFSTGSLGIARTLRTRREDPQRVELVAEPPTEPAVEESISLEELTRWLWDPARAFLEGHLGARFSSAKLYEPSSALTEVQPLDLARVGNEALAAGLHAQALRSFLAASPEFPAGSAGELRRSLAATEIERIAARTAELRGTGSYDARRVELDVGGIRLEGRIDGVAATHRVITRFTRPRRQSELQAWVEHLAMQCGGDGPETTLLALRGREARPTVVTFGRVSDPRRELDSLIGLYRRSREAPLPIFGSASRVLAEGVFEKRAAARNTARRRLESQRGYDPHLSFVLRSEDPFDDERRSDELQDAAVTLYQPLLQHRSES